MKALKIFLGLVVFGIIGASYLCLYEPAYDGLIKAAGSAGKPLVFAHRGFGNYAPDNSLISVKMAMEAKMDGVDVDSQITKDGELVIFHDLSVDRLTGGKGRVSSLTLPELQKLDLGPKFGKGFEGSYVATVEEFMQAVVGKGILMVELKVPGAKPTGIEERFVKLVQKYSAHESVFLSSFNPVVLYRLKKLDPKIHTVFIFMDTNWNEHLRAEIKPEDLVNLPFCLRSELCRRVIRKLIKPDLLSVNIEVKEKTIDGLIAKGYPVFLWVPETEDKIKWALAKKPFGIISDEMKLVKQIRDQ